MAKRGRPKLDDPRNNHLLIRLDSREQNHIDILHEEVGVSRAEIARRAIEQYYFRHQEMKKGV